MDYMCVKYSYLMLNLLYFLKPDTIYLKVPINALSYFLDQFNIKALYCTVDFHDIHFSVALIFG